METLSAKTEAKPKIAPWSAAIIGEKAGERKTLPGMPLFLRGAVESNTSEVAPLVQPKLAVNTPGDAFEQEADRVAEQVGSESPEPGISSLSTPTVQRAYACSGADDDCPVCRARTATIQRKATSSTSPSEPHDAVSRTLQTSGQPLDAGVRADMEARFGYDFGSVRVHTDPDASHSAQEINALAYTSGANIAFDAGQYRPGSTAGRKLLAHELTHVVQQASGSLPISQVQRQENNASYAPPNYSLNASFDPDAIVLDKLTNEMFLSELFRVMDWLAAHQPSDADYDAYVVLRGRLRSERERRVNMGHVWMAQANRSTQGLYQLVPGANGTTTVARADMGRVMGLPTDLGASPVMNKKQFEDFLRSQDIPILTAQQYLSFQRAGIGAAGGITGSRAYLPPLESGLELPFSQNDHSGWVGAMGEVSLQRSQRGVPGFEDLNLRGWMNSAGVVQEPQARNFPVFDLRGRSDNLLYSVKTSAKIKPIDRLDHYLNGMADMLGTVNPVEPNNFSDFMQNQPMGTNPADVRAAARVAINSDDVALLQNMLQNPNSLFASTSRKPNYERVKVRRVYNGILRDNPVSISDMNYDTVEALQNARIAGTITQAQFDGALQSTGQLAAAKVTSSEIATPRVQDLKALRGPMGNEDALRTLGVGEYLTEQRYGGGIKGSALAAGGAGMRGAVGGGLVAVVVEGGVMVFDSQQHPEALTELALAGGTGVIGGGVGGATEQVAASQVTKYLVSRGLMTVDAARLGRIGAGGVGGGVGGGAASIALEWARIGLEDRPHSDEEIALRTGRAFVIGGTSGLIGGATGTATATMMTSALTGTEIGTAFPGVGNVIGFIVGLGVGIGTAMLMDDVIPQVPASSPESH